MLSVGKLSVVTLSVVMLNIVAWRRCNISTNLQCCRKKLYNIGGDDNRLQRRHNQPNGKETSFTITELVTFLLKPFSLIDPKCLSSTFFPG
jgi:hypothetical protein